MVKFFIIPCLFILSISLASSSVFILDKLDAKYNYGELFDLRISLKEEHLADYVTTYLDCEQRKVVDKRFLTVEGTENLTLKILFDLEGECFIEVEFGNFNERSGDFEVRKDLKVEYSMNNQIFFPGETLKINGTSKRFDGISYDGTLTYEISDVITSSIEVIDGKFFINHTFREDISPKEYQIKIFATKEQQEKYLIDLGTNIKKLTVNSMPTSIQTIVPENILPDSNLTFQLNLLDQAGEIIPNEPIIFAIYNSQDQKVAEGTINSQTNKTFFLESNFTKGVSRIEALFGNLISQSHYNVEGLPKVITFQKEDGQIVFKNIGNEDYMGNQEINFSNEGGQETKYINLNLEIGEEKEIPAIPEGIYNITTSDKQFQNIPITGYSIFSGNTLKNTYFLITFLSFLFLISLFVFREKIIHKIFHFGKRKYPNSQIQNVATLKPLYPNHRLKKTPEKYFSLICIKSKKLSEYVQTTQKYGLKLKKINSDYGYIITAEDNPEIYLNFFKLSKEIYSLSKSKKDLLSISVNCSREPVRIEAVKKFVLIQKNLIEKFPNRFIIGETFFSNLNFSKKFYKQKSEVLGETQYFYVFN